MFKVLTILKKGQETLAALKVKPEITKNIIDATSKDILMRSKAAQLFNRIAGTRLGRYLSSALNFGSKIGGKRINGRCCLYIR